MMKYFISLLVKVIVLLSFFACKNDSIKTSLVIDLSNTGKEEIEVYNIEADIYHKLTGQKDTLRLDIEQPLILDLYQGRYHRDRKSVV